MPARRAESPQPRAEVAETDLPTLQEFVNSRAKRRKRARSAAQRLSVDDALDAAMQIIRQREADILRAVEYGQGLLEELADLKQSKDERESKLHHESAYASRRRDFQVREYQETIKALEERLSAKDADLKHKETTLSRMSQQLTTSRRELDESLAEVKLLRIENIGLQQIVSRQSKQRYPLVEGGAEGIGTIESKKAPAPVTDMPKELTRLHEQQVAQLRQQLQETEGLLEEERLRVATLQADQALKAYWATSGSVAALKARVEELEHQNAALLDCSARPTDPLQSPLHHSLQALRADVRALEAEARGMQQTYMEGLQCAGEVINKLVTQLSTEGSYHDAEAQKLLAAATAVWESFSCRAHLAPTRPDQSKARAEADVAPSHSTLGPADDCTTTREGPALEAGELRKQLRVTTAQLIACQHALDEERQRAGHSAHLLRRAILAEETSASELGRCVALMRRTQEMMASLRQERDEALRTRDVALARCRAGQRQMQQQLETAVQDRDVACRLALQYEQKWNAAQQNAGGRVALAASPGLSWLPRVGPPEPLPAAGAAPSPLPWRAADGRPAGSSALDLGIPHLRAEPLGTETTPCAASGHGPQPSPLRPPAEGATGAVTAGGAAKASETNPSLATPEAPSAVPVSYKLSTPPDKGPRSLAGPRSVALGDLTNTRSTLAWVHGKLKR
eukprot:EG_transcript_3924